MALVALVGILLISILDLSNAQCFRAEPLAHTSDYGTIEHFCVYNGTRFLSGSSFKLASPYCYDCSCTDLGLSCCGYGAMAGTMVVEGCRQVSDFCQVRFVDMLDPTKPCAALEPKITVLATDSTTTTIPNLPSDADSNSGQSESDSSDDQQNVTND